MHLPSLFDTGGNECPQGVLDGGQLVGQSQGAGVVPDPAAFLFCQGGQAVHRAAQGDRRGPVVVEAAQAQASQDTVKARGLRVFRLP